jgi:hypothetical protein
MAYELVKARIPYRQLYVPPPKRKVRDDWFSGIVQLRIERIDPTDAPVAYDVRHRDMAGDEHRYQIRIHEGLLWWPLGGDRFGLTFDRFAKLVEEGLPRSLAILDDPLGRCARELPSHAFPLPVFPEAYRRVNGELNNFHDQKARAERGASTIVICGEHVYVRAGEPIFYATAFSADDGDKRISIDIGCSHPSFEKSFAIHTPPDAVNRRTCLRRGFAFGIDEIDEAVRTVQARGFRVMQVDDIDVLIERHRPETAPLMCARELARRLFVVADMRRERLRAEVRAIGAATSGEQAEDQAVDALRQLRSSDDPIMVSGFPGARRFAETILARLGIGPSEALAPEDDAALTALSARVL